MIKAIVFDCFGVLVVDNGFSKKPANEALLDLIRDDLKPRYKIGMLSNAGGNFLDELFETKDLQLFDAIALSYEIGASKPNPLAYTTIADWLGVSIEECVFIDDSEDYCVAAEVVGMQAVHYQDNDQLLDKLQNYNII